MRLGVDGPNGSPPPESPRPAFAPPDRTSARVSCRLASTYAMHLPNLYCWHQLRKHVRRQCTAFKGLIQYADNE